VPLVSLRLPHLPWGLPASPAAFKEPQVSKGIHALPEVLVPIGYQISLGSQPLHWLALPTGLITGDILESVGLQDEKTAVDLAFTDLRLFGELGNPISVED